MSEGETNRDPAGFSKLNALCWWAEKTGVSYGTLSATCTEQQFQEIYEAYRKLCEERWRKQREVETAYRAWKRRHNTKKKPPLE